MKKISKYIMYLIVSLIVVISLLLHFVPVSFDAGVCTGGYRTWIADKYSEKLVHIFLSEQGLKQSTDFKIVSKHEDIKNAIDWVGRDIYATLKIDVEGKVYSVNYIGKRYWPDKYDWRIASIDS